MGSPDDEDGIPTPISFTKGAPATVNVTVNNPSAVPAYLKCWVDLDGNGTFDSGDAAASYSPSSTIAAGTTNGTVQVTWTTVPSNAPASTYLRCRISTNQNAIATAVTTQLVFGQTAGPGQVIAAPAIDSAHNGLNGNPPAFPAGNDSGYVGNDSWPDGEVEDYAVTIRALSADLQIVKTASPDPALVGQNLTYTLLVTNNGPDGATGVTVQDTLPAGVTFVSATPTQGTCGYAAGVVTCNLGNIANGGNATITVVVTVNSVLSASADANHATASAAPASPDATTTVPGLGAAAKFTMLALQGGYLQIHDNSELLGNVGYSAGTSNNECSKVGGSNGPFVGTIYAATGVNINQSSTCLNPGPTGGVLQSAASTALLAQANTDANNAFAFYNSLPADVTLGTAGDVQNFNNSAGTDNIFVADITTVNVNGSPWTLTGHPDGDDIFVFRISGSFDWSHGVVVPVNVRPERILWLFTNPAGGQHVLLNKDDNVFLGTILSPYDTLIEYHNPATFHGAIIAYKIYIHSASKISGFPFEVFDFGDAPDTGTSTGPGNYNTLMSDNGPRHVLVSGLTLGAVIDGETDGQPNTGATGDDTNGAPDDEDAVGALSFTAGSSPSVMVSGSNAYQTGNPLAGQQAFMKCWMDLNGNGSFTDSGEASSQITIPASSGTANYSVSFGSLTATGTTYLRCRLSLTAAEVANPTGAATSGEVEDYQVTIQAPRLCPPGQIYNVADVTGNELDPVLSNNSDDVCTNINRLGAIGNYVWVDENSDGYQDAGEPGLPNVTVKLYDTAGNVVATTYTDAHGGYLFDNVAPGSYFVRVDGTTLPAGMTQTPPSTLAGADFGNQDQSTGVNDYGYPVTIGGTQPLENLTADFGYNYNPTVCVNGDPACTETPPTAALGDRVWIDADGDGVQDPEEAGIPGVR